MKKRILVLGAGRVGRLIALDLAGDFEVTAADSDLNNLGALKSDGRVTTRQADFGKAGHAAGLSADFDLVVNALPGWLGFRNFREIVFAGKDVADISFFAEDPFDVNDRAVELGVKAVIDCGVAPGFCNVLLGHHLKEDVTSYKCMVGGLPFKREKPFEYKAPFSPSDVIEEYLRPARMRIDGREVVREALSDLEKVKFDEVGELEAFNTDGLRSLLRTTIIQNLSEKTLRYCGHADLMRAFRDAGFFSDEPVNAGGHSVSPRQLTSELLYRKWLPSAGEREFTIMRVEIESSVAKHVYDLFDVTDPVTGDSSMGRTTAYTCTAMVRLMAAGAIIVDGISAPEVVGKEEKSFSFIMSEMKKRGIKISYRKITK